MKLYAFWKYDNPPYLLGKEVAEVLEDGWVKVVGYDGYKFNPVKLVPLEVGLKLQQKLDAAKEKYDKEVQKAYQDLKKVVEEIAE